MTKGRLAGALGALVLAALPHGVAQDGVDAPLRRMLPERIRKAGVITVATDPHAPPYTFYGEDNSTLVGIERDAAAAGAAQMRAQGLRAFAFPGTDLVDPSVDAADAYIAVSASGRSVEPAKAMEVRPETPVFPGPDPSPGDRDDRLVPTGPGIDVTTPGMTGAPVTGDPFQQGGGSSGSSPSRYRAASEHVKDLPDTLTIAQRPDLILIQENDDEARTRALRPDGTRQRSTNGKWEHRTRWDKGLLRVDTWHEDGVHAEEIFELAPDGSLLTVTVNVDDGDATLSVVRVFRPDKAAES